MTSEPHCFFCTLWLCIGSNFKVPFFKSVRITARGQRPDGRPLIAEAVWVARIGPEGSGAQLVHAVMYSDRPMPEAAEIFFGGIKL